MLKSELNCNSKLNVRQKSQDSAEFSGCNTERLPVGSKILASQHIKGSQRMRRNNTIGKRQENNIELTIGSFTIKAAGPLGVLAAVAAFAMVYYLGT
jgi:hypothetical protein